MINEAFRSFLIVHFEGDFSQREDVRKVSQVFLFLTNLDWLTTFNIEEFVSAKAA